MSLGKREAWTKTQRMRHVIPDILALKVKKIPKEGYRNSQIIKAYKEQKKWEMNIRDDIDVVNIRVLAPKKSLLYVESVLAKEVNKILRLKGMASAFARLDYVQPPIFIGDYVLFEAAVKTSKIFGTAGRRKWKE